MPASAEQIANYLRAHRAFSPYAPRYGYPHGICMADMMPAATARELADEMVQNVGFQALALGGFLRTPDGELIVEAVELALPGADRRVVSFAVEVLTLAAASQSELTPLQAGGAVLG